MGGLYSTYLTIPACFKVMDMVVKQRGLEGEQNGGSVQENRVGRGAGARNLPTN